MPLEEKIFRAAVCSGLGALVLYFLCLAVGLASHTSFGEFRNALESREVVSAIALSLVSATAASAFALIAAVPAAYALSRYNFPGKAFADAILDLPIFISPIAIGAMLLLFFNTRPGAAIETMHPIAFDTWGIVLAQFTVVSALAVRLMKSTFDGIDPRYENVGRTLGCSRTAAFFRITLPLSKNGLLAAAIITWARAIGEFGATVTLAGATPYRTETLPVAIHLSFAGADIHRAATVIIILIAISLASLLLLRRVTGGKGFP